MYARGGRLIPWVLWPVADPVWSPEDWGRAATLDARFAALGAKEDERRQLVPCAVLRKKWPETRFPSHIEARLSELLMDL